MKKRHPPPAHQGRFLIRLRLARGTRIYFGMASISFNPGRGEDDIHMGMFELAMFVSVVVALYNLQQIKMILKDKGYVVDMLTGWYRDYQQFKNLARTEKDQKAKLKYQRILNGLHFSLGGFFFFAAMVMRNRL